MNEEDGTVGGGPVCSGGGGKKLYPGMLVAPLGVCHCMMPVRAWRIWLGVNMAVPY